MKILYLLICLFMNLNAYCDEVTALVHPLEVWQVDVPEKTIGSYRVTLSFFGQSYYKPDIDKKKYTSYEKIDSILTGFETVATFHNYYAGVVVPNGSNEPKRFSEAKRGEQTSPIIITGPQYFVSFQSGVLRGAQRDLFD